MHTHACARRHAQRFSRRFLETSSRQAGVLCCSLSALEAPGHDRGPNAGLWLHLRHQVLGSLSSADLLRFPSSCLRTPRPRRGGAHRLAPAGSLSHLHLARRELPCSDHTRCWGVCVVAWQPSARAPPVQVLSTVTALQRGADCSRPSPTLPLKLQPSAAGWARVPAAEPPRRWE